MSIEPHHFWQEIHPAGTFETDPAEGFTDFYPAAFADGRQLVLPIRVLPGDGDRAVASLIVNQASFTVEDALADAMADLARAYHPEVVIGIPTLGLPVANGVARRLGHARMVALGTSRKFWYRDDLSEPLSSITSPGHAKTLFIDPRMLPILAGRRVVVDDDVVSSGASMVSVLRLLRRAGLAPVAVVVAMLQSRRWEARLNEEAPQLAGHVHGAIASPLLHRSVGGNWHPAPMEVRH